MSAFYDFAGGFVDTIKADMDAKKEDERAASRYKKQLEIREELRKKAEETRVAATRMFAQNGDMGPPELMAQDVNARGFPVGSARPASQFEKEDHATRNQMAADKQRMEMEDRTMKQEQHKSRLERDKAATESSRASAASSRAYAENLKSGGLSGRPTVDPFKEESDLAYLVSAKQGGEQLDAQYQQELVSAQRAAQERGASEAQLAAIRQQLARDFTLKLKRLPNKSKED